MTMKNRNKGQIRVIETILASFIIVVALSFVNIFATTPSSPRYEATDLQKVGYNVLHDLDEQGLLPRFVYKGDWGSLRAALRVTLPSDVYFNMTVYDLYNTKLDDATIFYGDPQMFATSKNIASVTYGLVGSPIKIGAAYQAIYEPRVVILRLTRG